MAGPVCFRCDLPAIGVWTCGDPDCRFRRRSGGAPTRIYVCEDRANCWFCQACRSARGSYAEISNDTESNETESTESTLEVSSFPEISSASSNSDRIVRVAITIQSFMTPFNALLRGLEMPLWMQGMVPETVIVWWFSELYMTHFSILVQSSCGTLYRLERNPCKRKETTEKRVKFSSGGVDLREVLEPDLETLSLGAECSDGSIVCFVKEDPDIDWTKVHEYKREQEQAEYSTLFNNCQHMAYDFICKFKAAQDIPGFEVWCRRLQNQWRTFSNLPPST